MRSSSILLPLFLLTACVAWTAAAEPREWTSRDGSQQIRGVLVAQTGDAVTIAEENGKRRTIRKEFLSQADVDFLASSSAESGSGPGSSGPSAGQPAAGDRGQLAAVLAGKLIDARGRDAELDSTPAFFLFYYSASWCPPCRAFTPDLVRFYGRNRSRGNLQVILYPCDRSQEDSVAYLKKYSMPWPAIKLAEVDSPGIPRSNSPGIPAMVLTDKDGKVLLSSGQEMSREEFLKQTTTLLAEGN